MNKKIFLHIGSHKTGSTSIQGALAANKNALASMNMEFFHIDRISGRDGAANIHSWLRWQTPKELLPRGLCIAEPLLLSRYLSEIKTNVVMSGENLSFFFNKTPIAELKKILDEHFSEIEIICYIRRQDCQLVSHHQEGAKFDRLAENQLYGNEPVALPKHAPAHDIYLDYNQRLGLWADIFGEHNLTVRIFEKKQLFGGDAVADFFQLLNISTFQKTPVLNDSLGFSATKLGHLASSLPIKNEEEMYLTFASSLKGRSKKMLPSRGEAIDYVNSYRDSNRALNARMKISDNENIFDDDFSMYSDQAKDLWDEVSATETITQLLLLVDDSFSNQKKQQEISIDDLRDAAFALSQKKPQAALRLLRYAQKNRPKGTAIAKKIREIEAKL